jgi:serine/threonine protein phosphatase PrpC
MYPKRPEESEGNMISGLNSMSHLGLSIGCRTAQGIRENNEDRLVVDLENHLFLVADGMGGQENGERASSLAGEVIPHVIQERLAAQDDVAEAILRAMSEANDAIIEAGLDQPEGRRMGTTTVLALYWDNQVVIGNLGDSRAYRVRGDEVQLLTVDHSVAQALVLTGALTPEEARVSPYQHVLHKFLGCIGMGDGPDIHLFQPEAGDRLVLATDGLTNHITEDDLRDGAKEFSDLQAWADHLVETALKRGSRDNVTCIVLEFEAQ